jgi:hypothetical protein
VTAELACRSRKYVARSQASRLQSVPLAPPIPVGPAVVAEIQSDPMDFALVPSPLVGEPVAACATMFHSQ